MSDKSQSDNAFPPSQAVALASLVDYGEGAIVSRTLRKTKAGTMTVFAFDKGQALSEHSAPFDAYVQVLEGSVEVVIGGRPIEVSTGEMVLMPADIPHAVHAKQRFKMLLMMFKA
ncbi:MAG: cupin domain-containing protein [Acidobacteriota bacterium]|nr:cupin domain-containing protein [Acidobacteriota bacterium]MDQ7088366.1 cupin domain-containing protein [Acidobacteriota bacterium]